MNKDVIIDLDLVQQSAKSLKANPPSPDTVIADPKAFLAQCGIEISDKVAQLILSKPLTVAGTRQSSTVHIDF
jgi:hypothetical protein